MSTPLRQPSQQGRTPSQQGRTPSQQGRTPSQMAGAAPTPPVSTPFSASQVQTAFSPPTGSRTSPQQFKKSPAASQILKQHTGDNHASTSSMNFDSPSAAAAMGALGIGSNMDLTLDNLSMGTMGLGGRSEEDDRKRRTNQVISIIKAAAQGKVSMEGLERLAKTTGLECLWEDNPNGGPLSKTLVIAGHGLALDIIITNHVVQNVTLTYPDCSESVNKHVSKATDILLRDLQLSPGQSPLTKTIDKFQLNLERLHAMDKCSVLPALNCYNAIAGIYESLLKIHNWDVQKLREMDSIPAKRKTEDALRVTAMCTRHGCPLMHARDKIGLTLDYWKEGRRLLSTKVDSEHGQTWGMLIECAPKADFGLAMYAPVRVSERWISDAVEKTEHLTGGDMLENDGPVLDWQEPGQTFLPPTDETKTEPGVEGGAPAMGNALRTPDVIFTATLDPPVIMPLAAAGRIHTMAVLPMQESHVTFDALVFPVAPHIPYDASEPRVIERLQAVTSGPPPPGETVPMLKRHKNTLHINRPVYGQVMSKVPMSHPRQLVEMMPLLRQYAFLSTLLARSFKPKPHFPEVTEDKQESTFTTSAKDDFSRFMAGSGGDAKGKGVASDTTAAAPVLAIDMTLTSHPVPRLQIIFPLKSRTANITIEIRPGGTVHIVSENVLGSDGASDGKPPRFTTEQLASMLELTEDIGVWVEHLIKKLD